MVILYKFILQIRKKHLNNCKIIFLGAKKYFLFQIYNTIYTTFIFIYKFMLIKHVQFQLHHQMKCFQGFELWNRNQLILWKLEIVKPKIKGWKKQQ